MALTDSTHTKASTGSSFNCGASAVVVVVVVVVQPLIYSTPFAPNGIRTRAGAAPMNHVTGRSLVSEVRGCAVAAGGHAGWRMTQPRADDVGFRDSTLAHDWSVLFHAEASPRLLTGRGGRSPSPPLESCLDTVRPLSALPLRNQPQTGTNKGRRGNQPTTGGCFHGLVSGTTADGGDDPTFDLRGGLITCVWWCRHGPVSSTSPWLHC